MQILESAIEMSRKRGQARRKQAARAGHAVWRPRKQRSAFELLREAEHERLPHLVPLKYQRMAASPFSYFRGAAAVMAYDLGEAPHTGILCQLCGDAHARNLGSFAAPDGSLVFDINDFDETVVGPFEWDVKRMAASLHLAARDADVCEAECRHIVRAFVNRYGSSMIAFAGMPIVQIAHYQVHRKTEVAAMQSVFAQAARSTPLHLRDTLTELQNTTSTGAHAATRDAQARCFRNAPPTLTRLTQEEFAPVLDALVPYLASLQPDRRHLLSRYRPVDAAFKVVGIGSVGLRDYVLYLEGNGADDPLFLQIKQEVASAWAQYAPAHASAADIQGQRVVNGQRAMQVQSDPFLGITQLDGRDYIVRQLNAYKASLNTAALSKASLRHYASLCGELLARGHARSGDPNEIAGYIGRSTRFQKAIADFAREYADQTTNDWKELKHLLRPTS